MNYVFAKIRQRNKNKHRKVAETAEKVFSDFNMDAITEVPYSCSTLPDDETWFCINDASHQDFAIDLIKNSISTVDYDSLSRSEFERIDFIFVVSGNYTFFQNVTKARLLRKKSLMSLGESFFISDDAQIISINSLPDAIYDRESNKLYFRRIESISSIFRGIDQLYREATEAETQSFLQSDFIRLENGFSPQNVKAQYRKRIALAVDILSNFSVDERHEVFSYIGDYCTEIKNGDGSFSVGSEEQLKLLLYGIEQRFYTTVVGDEKRIANSVITLKT